MAGVVRQPIDLPSLERYITKHVPEIKVPLDLKQVNQPPLSPNLPNLSFISPPLPSQG